jgi:hypothetical protein
MQDVPNIVRERLKASTSASGHIDADVLTAFAEKSLLARERAVVLEHLARCGECRDVLALALPETEAVASSALPARSGWLTWPALRWGFIATGVVAIASLGVVQYQRHLSQVAMVAKDVSRPVNASAPSAQMQPSNAPAATPQASEEEENEKRPVATLLAPNPAPDTVNAKKLIARAEPGPAEPAQPNSRSQQFHRSTGGTGHAGALSFGPHQPSQQQALQQSQTQISTLAVVAPPAGQSVAGPIQSVPSTIPSATQTMTVEVATAANQIQTQSSEVHGDQYALVRAKPAETAQAAPAPSAAALVSGASQPRPSAFPVPAPRWTINSAGGLQRSFDQGYSWQDVEVNATVVPAANLAGAAAADATVAKEKSVISQAMKASPVTPVFRAVVANGTDVWAGGSNGALYHSTDAGSHWTRVIPASGGTTVTGDIVAIEFSDAQHGKINTSASEIWTTLDGGQTWQKQ